MLMRFARLAFVALTFRLSPESAQAGEPFVPSWIKNDSAAKTVKMEIVADWNQVARYAKDNIRTDIIDFNGYWGGNLTVMVPTGWSVNIEFINGSQSFRHSLMVTRVYTQSEMPRKLEAKDAIGAPTPIRRRESIPMKGDSSTSSLSSPGATSWPAPGKPI